MSVVTSGECGISPALLQAISSLTHPDTSHHADRLVAHSPLMEPPQQQQHQQLQQQQPESLGSVGKSVSHLLQGMNEPLKPLMTAGAGSSSSPSPPVPCNGNNGVGDGSTVLSPGVKPDAVLLNADVQERLATQLALKQERQQQRQQQQTLVSNPTGARVVSMGDMSNVLTVLASQAAAKVSIKQEEAHSYASYVSTPTPIPALTPATPTPSNPAPFLTTATPITSGSTVVSAASADVVVQGAINGCQGQRSQPQIIIYYNNNGQQEVATSQALLTDPDLLTSNAGGGGGQQQTVQNYRVILQPGDATTTSSATTLTSLAQLSSVAQTQSPMAVDVMASPTFSDGVGGTFTAMPMGFPSGDDPSASVTDPLALCAEALCPICGDKISGYHYGVYTCESCKGFFKRTVQNKKSFMCHKQGECLVVIQNRKKCPACRFAKCLAVGMKLEAIRQDRMRGGRSSYNGSLPLVKPRPLQTPRKLKRASCEGGGGGGGGSGMGNDGDMKAAVMAAVAAVTSGEQPATSTATLADSKAKGQLAALLNHSTALKQEAPPVPELLMDMMNMEALLADDELPAEGSEDGVTDAQSFYQYLMQLTELRLYKLVRWARNLPQFGAISTDDQILLLQNCWSDLLGLGVCWRSLGSGSVLTISATHAVSLQQAQALGFGEVASRLLSVSEGLSRLGVDQIEYVALKVLLLISPDVKGLREPSKVHDYQEKLSEALQTYTASHYPQTPNKLGEMLLRLPELSRISFMARETLVGVLTPNLASCGLLVELLKGENAAKD